jgi:hypothetical protein
MEFAGVKVRAMEFVAGAVRRMKIVAGGVWVWVRVGDGRCKEAARRLGVDCEG